jgi:sugar (pentulose or hexulose) kinase
MRNLLIGIDGGTGGIRAYIFTTNGEVVSMSASPYPTYYPKNGWAEQKPEDWWTALVFAVNGALKNGNIKAGRIAALCAATTSCTVLACDSSGRPLDNAILWMDVRASRESADIEKLTGQKLSAELFLSKILWLRRNNKTRYGQADILCEYQDYINYRLTGGWSFSINTACNWGYNHRKGGFDENFYKQMGMEDALKKLPPLAIKAGGRAGNLSKAGAEALGLDTEVLVVQGGIDSSIGMLGMGVTKPGTIALMTGSSNLAMAVTREPMFAPANAVNLGPDFLLDGYYTSFQGQASSGSILAWYKREFCKDLGEAAFKILDKAADDVPAGSNGVMILDYFQGNRVPYNDSDVRGVICGLSMQAAREQIYRAVMESVVYGTEDMLEAFRSRGEKIESLIVSGGAARSEVFMRIYADVCGVPLKVSSDFSTALGGAVCAAYARDFYPSLEQAAANMVRYGKIFKPNKSNYRLYRTLLKKYRALYPAIRRWMDSSEAEPPRS